MHMPFIADGQDQHGDLTAEVIPITFQKGNTLMAVCTPAAPYYITKEQAMKFFKLVPKDTNAI